MAGAGSSAQQISPAPAARDKEKNKEKEIAKKPKKDASAPKRSSTPPPPIVERNATNLRQWCMLHPLHATWTITFNVGNTKYVGGAFPGLSPGSLVRVGSAHRTRRTALLLPPHTHSVHPPASALLPCVIALSEHTIAEHWLARREKTKQYICLLDKYIQLPSPNFVCVSPRRYDQKHFRLAHDKAQRGYGIRLYQEWKEYGIPDYFLRTYGCPPLLV